MKRDFIREDISAAQNKKHSLKLGALLVWHKSMEERRVINPAEFYYFCTGVRASQSTKAFQVAKRLGREAQEPPR